MKKLALLVLSLFFLIYGVVFAYIHIKYINNSFYFESLPFDYFSADEALMVMVIKIIIGFKITYDKIQGINEMSVMNLIIGLLLFVRTFNTFGNRKFIVNHVYLKNFTAFLSFFYCIMYGCRGFYYVINAAHGRWRCHQQGPLPQQRLQGCSRR